MSQIDTPLYLIEMAKDAILGNYICNCVQNSNFHGKLMSDNCFEHFYHKNGKPRKLRYRNECFVTEDDKSIRYFYIVKTKAILFTNSYV